MELKIVTGMSGAGKTNLVQLLEDMGYYCVDNLPPDLFIRFVELLLQVPSAPTRVALVADVRGRGFFRDAYDVLPELKHKGIAYEIIFLEASDAALVRRFKETRRRHPLAENGGVLEGIRAERQRLQRIRGEADVIIDTSELTVPEFKRQAAALLGADADGRLLVNVLSFGFKYGLPIDVDLVMDARFLPNPYYVAELKPLSGLDAPVRAYVLERPATESFLTQYCRLLVELAPQYQAQGKQHLSLAVGCTGGRLPQAKVSVAHRDLRRPAGAEKPAES